MVIVMHDRNFVLETVNMKYDTVKGMDKKRLITIQDVIDNHEVRYYPECCPEYFATFRDIGNGRIQKVAIDLSKFRNRETIEYYHYR